VFLAGAEARRAARALEAMVPQEPPAGTPFVVGASPTERWAFCQSTLTSPPLRARAAPRHPAWALSDLWQADVRQTHTFQAWDAQQRRWEKLRARLAAASSSQTLVMDRGEEERRKTEAWQLDALTQPLEMQCGPAAWACSLRDNWTQWVHVGHPLWSGLTGMVRHAARAQQLAIVRRQPVHSVGRQERTTGHGIHHDVDFLAVHGFGLERMLREKCAEGLALPQVVRHLELTGRADVAQRLVEAAKEATATAREQQAEAAPTADEPDLQVDEEAPFLECCVAPQPGLQLSPLMLSFRGRMLPKQEGSAASVMVSNTGTSSLYYTWQLADSTHPGAASSFMPLPWSGPRPGVLLPGETRVVAFRFCPQRQGTAREIWQMRTAPPVDVRNSAVMLEGIARLGRGSDDAQQAASCDGQHLAEARRRALMQATDAFTARLKQAEALMSMA